ncbi:unnamed protein product [Dovyalis caffra]|uniref:tRNA-dihydrouridine(47) synthase [NAD(P)(+)] n=1 Tax=Dovyalis caffra TaxID=77055 RepID=A0AAV1R6Q0_9ROSI|nr:unnamed protein product [Dovyalis caffra]
MIHRFRFLWLRRLRRRVSHKDNDVVGNGTKRNSEVKDLNKDVQKLLWKNKMKFPKADSLLKSLGLMGSVKSKVRKRSKSRKSMMIMSRKSMMVMPLMVLMRVVVVMGAMIRLENWIVLWMAKDKTKEVRPLKKAKSVVEENGCIVEEVNVWPEIVETDGSLKKLIDFRGKLYLTPLTTVGNLPFRRVCKALGADVSCGEMVMCTNLLQGQASEWALLRRHSSEDLFGVQVCGAYPDTVMGCPIDIVVNKGAGSSLLTKAMQMKSIIEAASGTVEKPITVKVRTAYFEGKNRIDSLIADIGNWGASGITIHGRSRQQSYSKRAAWDYIFRCVKKASDSWQVLGNGDVFSYVDWTSTSLTAPSFLHA